MLVFRATLSVTDYERREASTSPRVAPSPPPPPPASRPRHPASHNMPHSQLAPKIWQILKLSLDFLFAQHACSFSYTSHIHLARQISKIKNKPKNICKNATKTVNNSQRGFQKLSEKNWAIFRLCLVTTTLPPFSIRCRCSAGKLGNLEAQ